MFVLCAGKLKSVEGDYEGYFVNGLKEGAGCFVNGFGDVYGETQESHHALFHIVLFM